MLKGTRITSPLVDPFRSQFTPMYRTSPSANGAQWTLCDNKTASAVIPAQWAFTECPFP